MNSCLEDHPYFPNSLTDFNPYMKQSENIDQLVLSKIKELTKSIWDNVSKNKDIKNDSNIYNGKIGIAYMFWYLSLQELYFDEKERKEFIQKAKELLKHCLQTLLKKKSDLRSRQSFIKGNIGLLLVACLVFDSSEDKEMRNYYLESFTRMALFCIPTEFTPNKSDSFFDGRAGYICGSLLINKIFKLQVIPNEILENLAFSSITSGYNTNSKFHSRLIYSDDGIVYLGNSEGFSGILLSLISIPSLLTDPEYESLVKESVDFVMSFQRANGKFPSSANSLKHSTESEETICWCNGTPGIAWLLAKAYCIWKEEKYKKACIRCGQIVWKRGLSQNSVGLCHGISGNGYTFLLLFKITQDIKHLHRAKQFAKFIISREYSEDIKKLKHPFSLYEGYSGVICFLIDVLNAAKDKRDPIFPLFFDIFHDYTERNTSEEEDDGQNETDFSKHLQLLKQYNSLY